MGNREEDNSPDACVAKKNCMQLGDLQDNASTVAAIGAIILASLVVLGLLLFRCYRWRRRNQFMKVLREIELEATGDWGQQGSKKRGAWDEDASSAFDWDEDDTAATSSGGEEHDAGRAFSSSSEDVGRFALGHGAVEDDQLFAQDAF